MGEQVSIETFDRFTSEIKKVYPKGAKIRIMSDGFVFNNLLGVHDNTVHQYKEICLDMAKGTSFEIIDLHDFYTGLSLQQKREKLMSQFGITTEKLEQEILYNADVNWLYKGMIRFMFEELAMKSFSSRNQHQKEAKKLARNMMFANEAYSNIVNHNFSSAIRLSMHPSLNNGRKFSFQMISEHSHHSAWHSAILMNQYTEEITTIHRKDAIEEGLELVYVNNQPSHFIR